MGVGFQHGGVGIRKYTVVVTNGSGSGIYKRGDICTAIASVPTNYKFVRWSDGATSNPYSFAVKRDITLTAAFEKLPPPSPATTSVYEIRNVTVFIPNPNPDWDWVTCEISGMGVCTNTSTNSYKKTINRTDSAPQYAYVSNGTGLVTISSIGKSGLTVRGSYTANTAKSLSCRVVFNYS